MPAAKGTSSKRASAPKAAYAGAGDASAQILGPRLLLGLSVLALVVIGLVMVYSASSIEAIDEGTNPESYLVKQIQFVIIGAIGMVILWKVIPYRLYIGPFLWFVWGAAVFLLVLVAVMGSVGLGAQRWLELGPVRLQPSEFAKIAFVLVMAKIMFNYRNGDLEFKAAAGQAILLVVAPMLFLYATQSDLGTTLICIVGIFTVLWIGEVPMKYILGVVAAGVVFALLAMTVGYRADRMIFLDPWQDYYGDGFQLIRSFYAFAEGGVFGVGLGNSREKFLYLPEAETDFIFAIIGEELGLIGALVVVALFLALLYAGIRISLNAPDAFGAMIAGGLTVMLVFQAFLNIGCVIGVLPTTGKPLPFISSGGSSLIASLFMVGLILAVSDGSGGLTVYEQRRQDLRVVRASSGNGRRTRQSGKAPRQSTARSTAGNARRTTGNGRRQGG